MSAPGVLVSRGDSPPLWRHAGLVGKYIDNHDTPEMFYDSGFLVDTWACGQLVALVRAAW